MLTYYLTFNVTPSPANQFFHDVEGAVASCWVLEDDPESAYMKAAFRVRQYHWEILKLEQEPKVVTIEDYDGKDIGAEQFLVAQRNGVATVYVGWAKDEKSSFGPIKLSRPDSFNLQSYLLDVKTLRNRGRCLHYNAGNRCTNFVKAHSIQKKGALSLIAENGNVYAPSGNIGDYKHSKGRVTLTKQGINKVSTFRGFCAKHDNDVFAPIDDSHIIPTKEQVLLFAYRAVCRELFVKENSLEFFNAQTQKVEKDPAFREMLDDICKGTEFGLTNLEYHKRILDQCIDKASYSQVRYVMFRTKQKPIAVFSGVIYPDYDFQGQQIQDLGDHTNTLDMLSFSFVPLEKGWGFLFAWHSSSSGACRRFMQSLATVVHGDEDVGGLLFRFLVSSCENLAVSPPWWEALKSKDRIDIESTASFGADILKIPKFDYLATGLQNVPKWDFVSVISEMDDVT